MPRRGAKLAVSIAAAAPAAAGPALVTGAAASCRARMQGRRNLMQWQCWAGRTLRVGFGCWRAMDDPRQRLVRVREGAGRARAELRRSGLRRRGGRPPPSHTPADAALRATPAGKCVGQRAGMRVARSRWMLVHACERGWAPGWASGFAPWRVCVGCSGVLTSPFIMRRRL